ncbi:hypothetical protein SAMN05216389_11335 [Oceanobacillus limi]|uniref:ABC-2 type transport system permease protein n=1 Tax=Oceanobacillus limi TaxID=930131 RepID=A0A1I0EZE8_9BACI|nr:hypothetical protein [Oceanobacillus limi]SET50898.1 hypothetical protein SAMN05216389_11335 [Oceanobacillus limi]
MLHTWKQAFSLAFFEIKALKYKTYLAFLSYLLISLVICVFLMKWFISNNELRHEALFLLIYLLGLSWIKPKELQNKIINDNVMASPIFVMNLHLPINQDILIKSRFIIYFMYTIPFQLFLLVGICLFSPLQKLLTIEMLTPFLLFWISFGILVDGVLVKIDIRINPSKYRHFLIGLFTYFIVTILLRVLHESTGYSLIDGSIFLAQEWPLITTCVTIFITALTTMLSNRKMLRLVRDTDYL